MADPMELVYSLVGYPDETEWLEFKENLTDPKRIARDISALANAAAYHGRDFAYRVWGVDDKDHVLKGTSFRPRSQKVGKSQNLSMWLKTKLSQNALYEFLETDCDGKHYVVLQIHAASAQPVYYDKNAYIREGSSSTLLEPGSAKERELWRRLQRGDFCNLVAEPDVGVSELDAHLDIDTFFELLDMRRPSDERALVKTLSEQELVREQDNGRLAITNLGALLIGRKLTSFRGLRKRMLRVVRFEGKGSFGILNDWSFDKGYALSLREAEERVMDCVPSTEVLEGAFRRVRHQAPRYAVRELLANAVMHQDLSDTTAGPLVSIYTNRIVFTNPGVSLIERERLLNAPPKSRNSALAGIMRQMDLCEEGGTGWDIAVSACEAQHIPAPKMETDETLGTRVTLLFDRAYDRMTKAERREATYWHACLLYAQDDAMSNQSLRERFGLDVERKNTVAISRLIRECCDIGLLRAEDEETSDRYRRYVPAWA